MSMLILSGETFNLVGTAAQLVMSSEDSSFPAARLHDGRPGAFARFASPAAADETITVDLERLSNAGFEAWAAGDPTSWIVETTGTGAVTEDTVTFNTGSSSAKLDGGTGSAWVTQTLEVRSGGRLRLGYALKTNTGDMNIRVRNLHTGRYYNGASWVTSTTAAVTHTGSTWLVSTLDVTLEGFDATRRDVCTLSIEIGTSGSGWADSLSALPAVDFASVHGHNVDPVVSVELRSSTDNFSGSDVLWGSFAVRQPSFYARLTPQYYRYWRLRFVGTSFVGPIWIGEWVLGEALSLRRPQRLGWQSHRTRRQIRNVLPSGEVTVYNRTVRPDRTLRLNFLYANEDERGEAEREILQRSGDGALPVVVVPFTSAATGGSFRTPSEREAPAVFGRIGDEWSVTLLGPSKLEADWSVRESPFPAADETV